MRRIITLVILFTCLKSVSTAQSSIRFGVGYATSMNSQLIGEESHITSSGGTQSGTIKGIYGSLGRGISLQAAFVRPMRKNNSLALDLELGYLIGKKYVLNSTYILGFPRKSSDVISAGSFQFTPSLSVTCPVGKYQLYTRVGPVIARTTLKFSESYYQNSSDIRLDYETEGVFNIGFRGAIGMNFRPASKTQFFAELNFTSLSCAPEKGRITKFTVGGASQLGYIDDRNVWFKKKYNFSDNSTKNIQTQPRYSLGSLAMQIGVKVAL